MNNEVKDEVVYLYLDDIIPNRFQPREVFDERALKELAVSIREHGVIQPIIVRKVNGKYEIIAGERRYKASALAGLTRIPAIIRDLDDKESSKVALLENLQRKNLSPIEEARTYQKILEIDQMTQEELAKTMGKSQSSVANKLRLLSLPDEIQDALLKEQISERHARSLLNIPDVKKQKEMLKKIINNKMSVRNLEEEIKQEFPKEQQDSEDELNSNQISLQKEFMNNAPLMPTMDLSTPEDNYGKIKIVPPEEDNSESQFINYGEINNEEEIINNIPTQLNFESNNEPVNISDIKENTQDLNYDKYQAGGLDSMLNIGSNSTGPSIDGDNFKFITPAEGIVKENSQNTQDDKSSDYFKPINNDNFNEEIPENFIAELSGVNYSIETAINKIKELVEDLKNHGIELKTDEMDFEKSYQVIIKIAK